MRPIGHIDELTRFSVAGWAADADNLGASVRVVLVVNGRELTRVPADTFRAGLDKIEPGATGKYGFRFYFDPPLSPFRRNEISVMVERSDKIVPRGHAIIEAISTGNPADGFRPGGGILVSTSGRSGSTVLMAILAEHPQIVVADKRPFEIELLCYYSYAFRTMIASGDHVMSLRPDRITAKENRYQLGFNPYTHADFRRNFANRTLFDEFQNKALPRRLGAAFRDIILDFYTAVAEDKGKPAPLYFAEKSLPEHEVRHGSRFIMGRVKEIVLIRDPRDVVCSFIHSAGTEFERTVRAIGSSATRFVEIEASGGDDVHFVKYEDLVREPQQTLRAMFAFLGLSPLANADPSQMTGVAQGHATSRSAEESIGRWRKDLSSAQLEQCKPFEAFLQTFGYEPKPPAPTVVDLAVAVGAQDLMAHSPQDAGQTPADDTHRDLMMQFESLGQNCEFGLVQRRCGAEPLGLLRFSSTPYAPLMKALRARFAGMGEATMLEVKVSETGREYMVEDKKYGFLYHAWVKIGEMTPQEILQRERQRLPLLIRKLQEDLTDGHKIFVFHGMQPLSDTQARELAEAIRAYGPGTLLWVERADASNPPGSVREIVPGLLKGHMDRFAPGDNAHDLSLACWITLCGNALRLAHRPLAGNKAA